MSVLNHTVYNNNMYTPRGMVVTPQRYGAGMPRVQNCGSVIVYYLSEFHATNNNGVVTVGTNANQTHTMNVKSKCRLFSYVSDTSSFANLKRQIKMNYYRR